MTASADRVGHVMPASREYVTGIVTRVKKARIARTAHRPTAVVTVSARGTKTVTPVRSTAVRLLSVGTGAATEARISVTVRRIVGILHRPRSVAAMVSTMIVIPLPTVTTQSALMIRPAHASRRIRHAHSMMSAVRASAEGINVDNLFSLGCSPWMKTQCGVG